MRRASLPRAVVKTRLKRLAFVRLQCCLLRACGASLCAAIALLGACNSASNRRPTPVADLASSFGAQAAFQDIRERWQRATPAERLALEPQLRVFRTRYPGDPLARTAGAYLGFIALQRGDLASAQAAADALMSGPEGNSRDLGVVLKGAVQLGTGHAEAALETLSPMDGKLLDDFAQELLYETSVRAAVKARSWFEAVAYMNEWLHASEGESGRTHALIAQLLASFPDEALAIAAATIQDSPARDTWDRGLQQLLAQRLALVAVQKADPQLARRAIESSRTAELHEQVQNLAHLAASGEQLARVDGTKVGLVLSTHSALARERSAEALGGAMHALQGQRELITRESKGPRDTQAFDQLAAAGASIVIAGYDAASASTAATYAEAHGLAVLVLAWPDPWPESLRFAAVLGANDTELANLSQAAAEQAHRPKLARIVAEGEPDALQGS